MKKLSTLGFLAACAAFLAASATASATTLFNNSGTFSTSNTVPGFATTSGTQTGRLSRNGISQDFSGTEAFPGNNNATVTFSYIAVTLTPAQLAGGPYVQIELDTQGLGLFASAYTNTYNPPSASNPSGSFSTNWLGDIGSSGDYSFGNTPNGTPDIAFFGVTVPTGSSLVLVLSTSGPGGSGVGTPYSLNVENFSTRDYTNAVPEPSTFAAVGAGLAGLGLVVRRRRSVGI